VRLGSGTNVNASGCDIGVYVNVGSGNFVPNGVQTGIGILFAEGSSGMIDSNTVANYQKGGIVVDGCNPSERPSCAATAPTSATVMNNTVTGLGPVDFIAQNGIQISRGAQATSLAGNTVSRNLYTQDATSGCEPGCVGSAVGVTAMGILFFQAGVPTPTVGAVASTNEVFDNQADIVIIK